MQLLENLKLHVVCILLDWTMLLSVTVQLQLPIFGGSRPQSSNSPWYRLAESSLDPLITRTQLMDQVATQRLKRQDVKRTVTLSNVQLWMWLIPHFCSGFVAQKSHGLTHPRGWSKKKAVLYTAKMGNQKNGKEQALVHTKWSLKSFVFLLDFSTDIMTSSKVAKWVIDFALAGYLEILFC